MRVDARMRERVRVRRCGPRMGAVARLLVLVGSAHGFSCAGPSSLQLHRTPYDPLARAAVVGSAAVAAPSATTSAGTQPLPPSQAYRYDHLQFFVDELKPLSHYKALEARLNELATSAL